MNTKEHILSVGEKLMLLKGFNATTVDDICKAAKITKGAFFHYFKNKTEFGKELAEEYWEKINGYFAAASFRKNKSALKRVYGWIDFLMNIPSNSLENDSCILGNFSQEISHTEPHIRKVCSDSFNEWMQDFKRDLDQALKESKKSSSISAADLSNQLIVISEGALLLAKAHKDPTIYIKSLKLFKKQIQSIFN
jgi:TetR/AcrR family transcriptional repressor of nem operon